MATRKRCRILDWKNADLTAGIYTQRPYGAAQTSPFRVRGTQVRVVTLDGAPVRGAQVYRVPVRGARGAPLTNQAGVPFVTDGQGYLQGRGQIVPGDQLVALMPITRTESYTLYETTAPPTAMGLDMARVSSAGVQTLTVSPRNTLMAFQLSLSVEWDLRGDGVYLDQLRRDLQRASEFLYDLTDGQAALGQITVYQSREQWDSAHVRIYASNRLRPNANQGGIVLTDTVDPDVAALVYEPGQVRMGAVWNRYGDSSRDLGDDWPRTLAHELAHFALYLDDNYLGLDASGRLVTVDGCPGAMTDPYRDDYSELHPAEGWAASCGQTLSNRGAGRADWSTIQRFYPWIRAPKVFNENPGPSTLPIDLTQVVVPAFDTAGDPPLEVPIFTTEREDGGRFLVSKQARAFIFPREGDRLIDLGRPVLNQVVARGIRSGDRLCIYDPTARAQGCEQVQPGDDRVTVATRASSPMPDILITPVTSTTIALTVTNVPVSEPLLATLYPIDVLTPTTIPLITSGTTAHGIFELTEVVLDGYIHVLAAGGNGSVDLVSDFTIGGSPGHVRSRKAPALSADGQAMLFGANLVFADGTFFVIQTLLTPPAPPSWATAVGQAYRVVASRGAPDLRTASLSISYLGDEVSAESESGIAIYYWDELGERCTPPGAAAPCWRKLDTALDTAQNFASAQVQGPGIYVLMSTRQIKLAQAGWNFVAYPLEQARPVTEALASVAGLYTTVYGYDPGELEDPWKVYDAGADIPDYVNDLSVLTPGRGYWINATSPITIDVPPALIASLDGTSAITAIPSPPATYFGEVLPADDLTPLLGQPVTALVDGVVCGTTRTRLHEGRVVYTVDVAAGTERLGCGALGRVVTFTVDGRSMTTTAQWISGRPQPLVLRRQTWHIFLPVAAR